MPDLQLTNAGPTLAALAGAGLYLLALGHRESFVRRLWCVWGGVVGGAVAATALPVEAFGDGSGQFATAALGGAFGCHVTSLLLESAPPEGAPAPEPSVGILPAEIRWPPVSRVVALAITSVALSCVLATVGLGAVAILVLALPAAASLTRRGWSPAAAFFCVLSVLSAVEVLVGRVVLSPLGLVGSPVATTVVATACLAPLVGLSASRAAWAHFARRLTMLDAAAFVAAPMAGWAWWAVFRDLPRSAIVSQLLRLGEDNLSHLVMLRATESTGSALGTTQASYDIAGFLAGYFPGGSLWQSSLGSLLPAVSPEQLFVLATAVMLAMLAGSVVGLPGLVIHRPGIVTVLAVVAVAAVGVRAHLSMYERGFPGQLLVGCWLVTGLTLLVAPSIDRSARVMRAMTLVLLVLAALLTWNLGAPLLAVPVAVLVSEAVLRRRRFSRRVVVVGATTLVLVGTVGAVAGRAQILNALDSLTTLGGIFQGVPLWFAYGLLLALPLGYRALGREIPWSTTAFALGMGSATVGLAAWQLVRVGAVNYYTFKLEYLLLSVGWAGAALLAGALAARAKRPPKPLLAFVGLLALALALELLLWPARSYRSWLSDNGLLGADPATACAIDIARDSPASVVLATGFGEPLANYLTTKATAAGVGNSSSAAFWAPILQQPNPATWPWAKERRQLLIVRGPSATPATTKAITAAARAAGARAAISDHSCPPPP